MRLRRGRFADSLSWNIIGILHFPVSIISTLQFYPVSACRNGVSAIRSAAQQAETVADVIFSSVDFCPTS